MSFTYVDNGFAQRRYSFDSPVLRFPDIEASDEFDATSRSDCATCTRTSIDGCAACADRELLLVANSIVLQASTNTMGDDNSPDEVDDDDDDDEDDEEDAEAEDDDTASERA